MKTANYGLTLFGDTHCAAAHGRCARKPASVRPQGLTGHPQLNKPHKTTNENYLRSLDYARLLSVGGTRLRGPDKFREHLQPAIG